MGGATQNFCAPLSSLEASRSILMHAMTDLMIQESWLCHLVVHKNQNKILCISRIYEYEYEKR